MRTGRRSRTPRGNSVAGLPQPPYMPGMLWRTSKRRSSHPPGFIEPCIPTVAMRVPVGPLWIHEVKQDGYRMIARRGDAVRLLTRNGFDWTKRYPLIAAALERLPAKSATIDGEAVWVDENGIGDF